MNSKLRVFLFCAAGMALILLAATSVLATDEIKNQLVASGVSHIYIDYENPEKQDYIEIFNAEDLAAVCTMDGVIAVAIADDEHICEPI